MDYADRTEHDLYKEGAAFTQAINKKLGHPTQTDNPDEVIGCLKQELQDAIVKKNLRVFEGIYGWAYTVQYGRSGDVKMLTTKDLK